MDITPEELIDTTENKPISTEPEAHEEKIPVKATKVKDLTTEERMALINEAKSGIENPFFRVQFYKNGNSRIVKRKQPLESTSEKIIKTKGSSLTTEQLLMEHVIGLESQLASLRQKQKKLKKNYKSLCQDVYVDIDDIEGQSTNANTTITTTALNDKQDNSVTQNENLQESQSQPNIFKREKRGWRARIAESMI